MTDSESHRIRFGLVSDTTRNTVIGRKKRKGKGLLLGRNAA